MVGKLFGTTGIRGVANEFLTPEFSAKISCIFGNYIKKRENKDKVKILIGRDTRTSSDMLKYGAISGLLSAGCDIYDTGIIPTPGLQYAIRKLKFDGGIMITGSHIPPERNGMKFFLSDSNEVYGEIEKEIEDAYFSEKFERAKWNEIGEVKSINAGEVYEEMLLKEGIKVEKEKALKIVVDTVHGAQSEIVPRVLRKLNHKVITLNAQMDGFFPGRYPEPEKKNLEILINTVKNLNADIGIAFDCDGDRSIFIDDKGNYIMGDVIGAILADKYVKEGDVVVTTVSTSSIIDYVVEKKKGIVERTRVGAADVVGKIIEKNAIFGFEENGGSIFPDLNLGREGGLTVVKILKILYERNEKFSDVIEKYPKFYQIKDKFPCEDNLKNKLTEKIKEIFEKQKDLIKTDETDGIKGIFENGWILFRPSWTEPIYRIFVEGKTEEQAKKLYEIGMNIVKEAKEKL